MKFLVRDNQSERHEAIRAYLTQDTAIIAALLAAADLEWTIRRVLDHVSYQANDVLDQKHVSGLHGYAIRWKKIIRGPNKKSLEEVVADWGALGDAFQLRHDIVHGRKGSSGLDYVIKQVDCILAASAAVAEHGNDIGAPPYKRLRKANLAGPTRK